MGRGEIKGRYQVGRGIRGVRDEVIVTEMENFAQSPATPHGGLGRGRGHRERAGSWGRGPRLQAQRGAVGRLGP